MSGTMGDPTCSCGADAVDFAFAAPTAAVDADVFGDGCFDVDEEDDAAAAAQGLGLPPGPATSNTDFVVGRAL